MPVVLQDRIDTLELEERNGVIRSMTRVCRVMFKPEEVKGNYQILSQSLLALDAVGLTYLSDLSGVDRYDALVLVGRSPKLVGDPGCVDVTLKYEHVLDGPNQNLHRPKSGVIFGKGRTSIAEKSTNFYYPYGDPKNGKVQILTSHAFKSSDVEVAAMNLTPNFPMTVFQGGEVNIPFPQANFKLQGVILGISDPWKVASAFIACINVKEWLTRPALTWICSEVEWDVLDVGFQNPARQGYKFGFEFQYNLDGWWPTVVFNDQRTGRPPANVRPATTINPEDKPDAKAVNPVDGSIGVKSYMVNPYTEGLPSYATVIQPAGYWDVPCLKPVNFDQLFGAYFEGPTPQGQS
jgi:hypothetical protein